MSTPANPSHVLIVGHCHVDGPRITRFLARNFIGALVDRVATKEEALASAAATRYDLALVNRILDLDGSPGVEVITALRAAQPALPIMLISDYPEAQEEATKLGALQGFGKAALESAETEELLRSVLKNP